MSEDDVVMTMNVSQFETSLTKVLTGFMKIDKSVGDQDRKGQASVNKMSSWMVAKGAMMASAIAGAARSVVSTVSGNIPEIGKTFDIAKDIIFRNLLWPLRKELIPILQGILNWVRDHRAAFVRMGAIIVSVFRAIKAIVSSFIDLVKNVWSHLAKGIEAIFGKTTQSVSDILNLILFKISAIAIFVMELLTPFFTWIADQLTLVYGMVTDLVSGIGEGLGDLSVNLNDFIALFRDLADMMGLSNDAAGALGRTLKSLGIIIGMTVKPMLAAAAEYLQYIISSIDGVVTAAKWAYFKLKGSDKEAKKVLEEADIRFEKRKQQSVARWTDVKKNTVEGAGKIKDTWTGNAVTATEKANRNITNVTNKNTNQTVTINVQGSHDPKATAKAVSDRLQSEKEKTMSPR